MLSPEANGQHTPTHAHQHGHTQEDGWLDGNKPTITVEMWDMWSEDQETAAAAAPLLGRMPNMWRGDTRLCL